MTADAVDIGSVVGETEDDLAQKLEELNRYGFNYFYSLRNLRADSKAVTSCSSSSKLNRASSKTSLISSLSDGSYRTSDSSRCVTACS